MKLRIYKMLGEGFIVAEELERTQANIFVRYPSVLKMFPGQKPTEVIFKLLDLVPEFFEDYEKLIKRFPLKQDLIYMSARPNQTIKGWYEQYLKDLSKKLAEASTKKFEKETNIKVVGPDALKNLPKHPDGEFKKH